MEILARTFTIAYNTLINLLPYVLLGVLVSECLKFIKWTDFLARLPRKTPILTTVIATFTGIVSPLCTYGSIPIVVTLFRLGFPLQPLMTFLIASSLMSPQLFLLTYGGISPEMAWLRLALCVLFSLIFGLGILKISPNWILSTNFKKEEGAFTVRERSFTWPGFVKSSFDSLQYIGFYIVLGILIGTVIEVFVPVKWFLIVFQSHEWIGILLGAVLGVPLYVCGGGTIPLIQSMMTAGMSTGAALAFFLVGPATRVTPLMALATLIRPRFIFSFFI